MLRIASILLRLLIRHRSSYTNRHPCAFMRKKGGRRFFLLKAPLMRRRRALPFVCKQRVDRDRSRECFEICLRFVRASVCSHSSVQMYRLVLLALPTHYRSVRVSAHTRGMEWAPSPSPSVWRKRVALEGPQESGRVTSVVRENASELNGTFAPYD